jgi:hypothetical protein
MKSLKKLGAKLKSKRNTNVKQGLSGPTSNAVADGACYQRSKVCAHVLILFAASTGITSQALAPVMPTVNPLPLAQPGVTPDAARFIHFTLYCSTLILLHRHPVV